MDFSNKTVLLTGASSGIGYSLAKLLPKEKCSIALLSRRENILNNLANELKISGVQVKAYKCDVGKIDEVRNTFDQVKKDFGKIDIAILNAGTSSRADVRKFSSSTAKEIFEANTFGIINCIEQLLPDFIKRKEGMIVGVSSLAESRGYPQKWFLQCEQSRSNFTSGKFES